MKLGDLYRTAVRIGIENDLRGKEEIEGILQEEKEKFEKLSEQDREYYDQDRLFNPYADTRILNGDPEAELKKVLLGIDMEVGEVLLAHLLNKEPGSKFDLIVAHHPEGYALARLADVMKLQADLLAAYGVAVSVAEQLMEKRISEVERRLLPVNHNRSVDVAKMLGLPMMCIHTPSDNCVTSYLKKALERENPSRLKDLMKILLAIPEYKNAARNQVPPKILAGSENSKCGKIYVDMTGGTEGSKEIFEKYTTSGISTLVGMHFSEDHLEKAKKANLNVFVAGHIASDNLGLNLLLDEVEKIEPLEIIPISGFERTRRPI